MRPRATCISSMLAPPRSQHGSLSVNYPAGSLSVSGWIIFSFLLDHFQYLAGSLSVSCWITFSILLLSVFCAGDEVEATMLRLALGHLSVSIAKSILAADLDKVPQGHVCRLQ